VTSHLPIAYLPGASGRGAVLGPVAARLAKRREPHVVDYPELSSAPKVAGIDSLDDLCRHVGAQLPPRFDAVALSMGVAIALRLALAAPERVRRLVLVAPAGGVDVRALGGVDWRPAFTSRRPDAPRWFVDDAVDLTPQLSLVRAPTLIVCGEHDLVAPVAVGRYLLERLPEARLETIPGATHDLEQEFPDLIASLVEAHLRAAA
jgi:pimeloyl-ACP methyl ester carboxylesterase